MPRRIPKHIQGMLNYLETGDETRYKDEVTQFFRHLTKKQFDPQQGTDGYIKGKIIIEIKGKESDWLSGFIQAIAYWKNKHLECNLITVITKKNILVWETRKISKSLIKDVKKLESKAPSSIGKLLAKKVSETKKTTLLNMTLFRFQLTENPHFNIEKVKQFSEIIIKCEFTRLSITQRNFIDIVKLMVEFFENPMDAVKAFYTMINYWGRQSSITIPTSRRHQNTVILTYQDSPLIIDKAISGKRNILKQFIETYHISVNEHNNVDQFFSKYDRAVYAVDPEYTRTNGVVFTPQDLAIFSMFMVKEHLGENFGEKYLVIDPAAGSGNLISNWKSPLKMRYKVISELEPYFLDAIENRLKIDGFHYGKYTVVPKEDDSFLNFVDKSAQKYLEIVKQNIPAKEDLDKPIAFLCNPPYRNDDEQSASDKRYSIDESIVKAIGKDSSNELYICFLAQMKLILQKAEKGIRKGNSTLILFTQTNWLNNDRASKNLRELILSKCKFIDGYIVTANKFFDRKLVGKWPLAFTIWEYLGEKAKLDPYRIISLKNLTWIDRKTITPVSELKYRNILNDMRSQNVPYGINRVSIDTWVGEKMYDFKKSRTQKDLALCKTIVGGLPADDSRRNNKKKYGVNNGQYIGFMDDLTPCRIDRPTNDSPWFRLDSNFMSIKRIRACSGPTDKYSYCATDYDLGQKLFIWFAMAKVFQIEYPIWANTMSIWKPECNKEQLEAITCYSFAIGYADNECIEAWFPSDNPIDEAPALYVANPMSSLNNNSFWNVYMRSICKESQILKVNQLVTSVNKIYKKWKAIIAKNDPRQIDIEFSRPYFIEEMPRLTINAGLVQIWEYARESDNMDLLQLFEQKKLILKELKSEFLDYLSDPNGINYFGLPQDYSEAV